MGFMIDVDYFILGENFLNMKPLIESAKFYVNEDHVNKAIKLLKYFEQKIFGVSKRRE